MTRTLPLIPLLFLGACAMSFEPQGLGDGGVGAADDAGLSNDGGNSSGRDGGGPSDRGVEYTVTLLISGGGSASFTSNPPGLDSDGGGMFQVAPGSSWTVTANPNGDWEFVEWRSGPCDSSTSRSCHFTVDADVLLRAYLKRP